MKKAVSVLLCVFLLLALLPAEALAVENQVENQLYFKNNATYDTFLGLPYGDTNLITFSIDDGQGGKTDLDGSYTVGGPNMGSFSWVDNGTVKGFHWDTTQNGGLPGNEGLVSAQKQDGPCYQISCRINDPVVGVYLDEAGTPFCPGGRVDYTPGTEKTVCLKTGDGFTFAATPTGNPDSVTVEEISNTLVKLTLAATAVGTVNVNLNCSISPCGEPFNRACTVIFAEPGPAYEQLYFLGQSGAESGLGRPYGDMSMWKLAVPNGQGGFIELDNGWHVWTDSGIGDFISQGPNGFLWDTNTGVPGTGGYVYARQGENGPIYRMAANVNAPMAGLYSAQPTENPAENFCPGNRLRYQTGESAVAYLKLGWDTISGDITSANDKISAVKINDSVAEVTLAAGCSGTVSTELTIPTANAELKVTVTFVDAEPLFNADFSDQQHPVFSDKLTGVQGDGMPLSLFVNRGNGMEPLGDGFTFTATLGQVVQPQEPGPAYIWDIPSDTEPGFGIITAVNGSESYRMQVVVGIPQHKATAAEVLPTALEQGLYTDEYKSLNPEKIQPAEFKLGGSTYYMAAGALDGMGPGGPITWGSLNPEDSVTTLGTVGIDFYTFDKGSGYTPVSPELRAQLTAAFNGSLCLTMYAEREDQTYPAMFPSALDYACARTYTYDGSVRGRMFFVAEGTIGNKTLRSLGMFEYNPLHVEEVHYSTIADVNSYLATELVDNAPNAMYKIYLDADELTGTIVVPESYSNADVYIYGKGWSNDRSGTGTTLTGSIDADAHLFLYGMNLVGKGKAVEENNVGLTGDDIVQYFGCSFTGYYHAVKTTKGLRFGGSGCTFRDNHVGVYLEMNPHYSDGGNPWMRNFLFEDNDIAIQCVRFSTTLPMYEFKITQSSFLENAQDIVNTSGRYLCVPGNYFYHSDWQPNKGKSLNAYSSGHVTIYPVATEQFGGGGLNYAIDEKSVVLSNQLAGDYRIPDAVLNGKTLSVIDNGLEDIPLGTWSFGGDAE